MTFLILALLIQDDLATRWKASYEKGAAFLAQGQNADGLWERELQGKKWPSMALTVLAIDALSGMPAALKEKHRPCIEKGIAAILKAQDEKDGSWCEPPGQLKAYVTSLAIRVLDPEKHRERIEKAQKYLVALQQENGGVGYGEVQYEFVDGKLEPRVAKDSNLGTVNEVSEGLRATGLKDKQYWDKIVKFLEQCQNFSEGELDPEWRQALDMKGFKIGDDGGFFYKPDVDNVENYAGARTDNDGKKIINSYGSMTYAGLKTYLYAGLSKDDARVKGAVQWIRHHYSLDRHPGFPFEQDTPGRKRKDQQGLYYYYMTMALALEAWGEKPFVTSDGVKHDWPRELARKLIELQENDGSWFNDQVRWWEGDKQLVTPYALKMYAILSKHF